MVDRSFVAENDAERARLITFIENLTDDQLMHSMPAGWTVAGVLAHMAFWDARAVYLIKKWQGGIAPSEADLETGDVNWVNESAKPLCLALPLRNAVQVVLELAEEADSLVASMSDELIEQMLAIGTPFYLSRANHRREHLDEIANHLQLTL